MHDLETKTAEQDTERLRKLREERDDEMMSAVKNLVNMSINFRKWEEHLSIAQDAIAVKDYEKANENLKLAHKEMKSVTKLIGQAYNLSNLVG